MGLLALCLLLPLLVAQPSHAGSSPSETQNLNLEKTHFSGNFSDIFENAKYFERLVPAMFVFGDSLVDNGNNNFLDTIAKANYPPYGVNFFGSKPTGRFTDGRNAADFIAQLAGLPMPTPYLEHLTASKPMPRKGANFASGACGILPETGKASGGCMPFGKQIEIFEMGLQKLKEEFKDEARFSHYLSKSLFYISTGNNDYGEYLNPQTGLGHKFTPPAFAEFLLKEFAAKLQKLYAIGGRKFLVNNIGAIGCTPAMINTVKPPSGCVDKLNSLVDLFNDRLPAVLSNLKSQLTGFTYVISNTNHFVLDVEASPAKYGITNTRTNCCVDMSGKGTTPCAPNQPPCKEVNSTLFFDPFHPSQVAHYWLVKRCYKESTICTPMNLDSLLRA